ncbi:MAG: type II toxin-antitoxin system RelE/ParE family toxin [Nanoarchaeota archaeon]
MVEIILDPLFESKIRKIKDSFLKTRIEKQMDKIIADPEIGKPMRYARKGTREVYLGSFRLSYAYLQGENKLIFLDLYHKDEQ